MLVLQGGGALGAYQAGVYEALASKGHHPEWIAGISIGAINGALIAGNAPEDRIDRLREFWHRVSSHLMLPAPAKEGVSRRWYNEVSAALVMMTGAPGMFQPHLVHPSFAWPGSPEALSYYDTRPLRDTLLELVDFDRVNTGGMRFSIGAVNVLTGNFSYFDNTECTIGPEHVMASGALPPGFAPVLIDGEPYWDGGLVSNTPLQYVLDVRPDCNMTIFQVDLFSARGTMPETLTDVLQREKDIRYSSRTRLNTDLGKALERMHGAARRLADKLPPELQNDPDLKLLLRARHDGAVTILHLINRCQSFESQSKDYEFSRQSIDEHWACGNADTEHSLEHPRWRERAVHDTGVVTFDLAQECDKGESDEA